MDVTEAFCNSTADKQKLLGHSKPPELGIADVKFSSIFEYLIFRADISFVLGFSWARKHSPLRRKGLKGAQQLSEHVQGLLEAECKR